MHEPINFAKKIGIFKKRNIGNTKTVYVEARVSLVKLMIMTVSLCNSPIAAHSYDPFSPAVSVRFFNVTVNLGFLWTCFFWARVRLNRVRSKQTGFSML